VFYPLVSSYTNSSLYTPLVDGWNVVESASLMFLHVFGAITKDELIDQLSARLMLCACVSVACKNAADTDAFPLLRATHYQYTPLSVVYLTLFERIVPNWSGQENDAMSMQRRIEEAEGYVIKRADNELFRLLNDTPTLRFEAEIFDIMPNDGCLDGQNSSDFFCLLRNFVSFYVFQTLMSSETEVRTIATRRPTTETTHAFAVIAVESLLCDLKARDVPTSIPAPLTRLATETPKSSYILSILIVENAIKVRANSKKDKQPFDSDTMRVVLNALQNSCTARTVTEVGGLVVEGSAPR
jgi:hypothetical protein